MNDEDFQVRPGPLRDRGVRGGKPKSLVAQVRALSSKAGRIGIPGHGRRGTGRNALGRSAMLRMRTMQGQRRVLVKARVVRHVGTRFSSAPLARHLAYLRREGVARDGRDAELLGCEDKQIDAASFAERCAEDRHHFRFIVSPEDAAELGDLKTFTSELVSQMEKDLGTRLDWAAVDHWNTDNPHVHLLVRGKAHDGSDLVIDKDYIREGLRTRAEQLVTLELGPRSEREIDRALVREIDVDRWTSLDRRLQRMANDLGGLIDLRPGQQGKQPDIYRHLIGRAGKLERLGLARVIAPACWKLQPDLEPTLRALGIRGDRIKTMHHAMSGLGLAAEPGRFALHGAVADMSVVGRLVERGLHDELTGEAYAVVDGADGRVHHLRFCDLDRTGDAPPGAIVEVRSWTDSKGRHGQNLWLQSDLPLGDQVTARGCTWLDRQLLASDPVRLGGGFGSEIEQARFARAEHLVGEGLAERKGDRFVLGRDLLARLRARELGDAAEDFVQRSGLPHRPIGPGEAIAGTYRERLSLASGRFAVIDDGLGFQLVPWRPELDSYLGRQVSGTMKAGGGIEWALGRSRGLGI